VKGWQMGQQLVNCKRVGTSENGFPIYELDNSVRPGQSPLPDEFRATVIRLPSVKGGSLPAQITRFKRVSTSENGHPTYKLDNSTSRGQRPLPEQFRATVDFRRAPEKPPSSDKVSAPGRPDKAYPPGRPDKEHPMEDRYLGDDVP
jgi:hypothetical protein